MLFVEFNLVYITSRKIPFFFSRENTKRTRTCRYFPRGFHFKLRSRFFKFYITLDAFLNAVINTVITFNAIIVA